MRRKGHSASQPALLILSSVSCGPGQIRAILASARAVAPLLRSEKPGGRRRRRLTLMERRYHFCGRVISTVEKMCRKSNFLWPSWPQCLPVPWSGRVRCAALAAWLVGWQADTAAHSPPSAAQYSPKHIHRHTLTHRRVDFWGAKLILCAIITRARSLSN